MSIVKPGDSVSTVFSTDDTNGSGVGPSALPQGKIWRNGAVDNAVTVTIALVGGAALSIHSASFTIPVTYSVGDQVNLEIFYVTPFGGVPATAPFRAAVIFPWERTLSNVPAAPSVGPGADQVTIKIEDPASLFPVPDADVWITSDQAGMNVIAGTLQTDGAGEALFLLDDGVTYYLWMQKEGQKSIRGKQFVAQADP